MRAYFTRDRFRRPQFLAGLLLLAFLAQALLLVRAELRTGSQPEGPEAARIAEGWKQWHGKGIAGAPFLDSVTDGSQMSYPVPAPRFESERSPLLYLVSAAPLLVWPHDLSPDSAHYWRWLPRLPFLACGLFLGASLWYVSRRLCGNTGGFLALAFYCFSPSLIQASAGWHTEPNIAAAWGAFGAIFTAIAVAHTLYAPREVILWNWRRIMLLGVALSIAIGSQFSLIVVVPVALAFLLYVAPVRRRAGFVIWLASCIVAAGLLFAFYFFHGHAFAAGLRHAAFWDASFSGFIVFAVYKQIALQIARACPALPIAVPAALAIYASWPRTRYFGNTAPLLVAVLFLGLVLAHPDASAAGFLLAAVPFLFLFVSGVLADLLESTYRSIVGACVAGLMLAYVAWSLFNLAQVAQG